MTKGFNFTAIANNEFELFGNKGVINQDKRVLIIGLGGTGTDTLLATKDTILNRFDLKGKKFPDNIKLLAIDTDNGILDKSRGTTKIERHELIQLNDPNIVAAVHNKALMPDFFKNWVNPALTIPAGAQVGSKGAGAIRQIGRYLLISNYKKVYEAISAQIKAVMIAAPGGTVTDIIIFSGISGGTGSGTFIDMGYIVRKVCNDLVIGDLQKQITAYLYLPDVNLGNPDVPSSSAAFIKCNGYAALKDLDYFMSIPHKKQVSAVADAEKPYKFVQQYDFNTTVESEEAPFDATYLISGVPDTISPVKDAYEYSINITADSIVNFIAGSEDKTGHTNTTPGKEAVDINGAAMNAQNPFIKRADGTNLLANYDYKIIGASMASLPMKEITDCVASEFLKKIDMLKKQKPSAEDFQSMYKTVGLSVQGLADKVYKLVGEPNTAITGEDFKSNDPNSGKNILMKNLSKYLNNAKTNVPGYAETVIASLESELTNQIDNAFTDINKGPFFANALMADPKNGAIAQLISIATKLLNRSNAFSSDASKLHIGADESFLKAESAIVGKAKKYQQFINEKSAECRSIIFSEICKELAGTINNSNALGKNSPLVDRIRHKNKSVYDVYTLILDTLAKRFSSDNISVHAQNMGRVFVWNIVQISEVTPDIKNRIGTMDLDKALNSLLVDMVKNSQKWCDSNTALTEFGEFLNNQFQEILGQSMDVFLSSLDSETLKKNIARLDRDAKVHFPSNNAIASMPSNIYDKVTVPADAPRLNEMIIKYLSDHHSTKEPELSLLYERISWVRVCIGVPIFQYAYLQGYETAYENVDPNHKQGMHLYENEGVHGKDYPALLPDVYWEHSYTNKREKARAAKMNGLFDKAENLNLVGYLPSSAYIIVTPDGWVDEETNAVLAKYGLTRDTINSMCLTVNEIQSCTAELNELKQKKVSETHIYLPDTADRPDVRYYAKESFCRMPEAGVMVQKEIEKREKLDDIINTMQDALTAFSKEKDVYMAFVYSFAFEILKSQGAKCVYDTGDSIEELANKFKDKFWRYLAFKEFEKVIYPIEKERIEQEINDALDSNEEIAHLLDICKSSVKEMTPELKETVFLNDDEENKDIKSFYNKLRMFLTDEIDRFKNMGIE